MLQLLRPTRVNTEKEATKSVEERYEEEEDVEFLASEGIDGVSEEVWVLCIVLQTNRDGTYDLEYTDEWAWMGQVRKVRASRMRKVGSKQRQRYKGLSDSEDEAWRYCSSTPCTQRGLPQDLDRVLSGMRRWWHR